MTRCAGLGSGGDPGSEPVTVLFRFYEELNEHLPPGRRKVAFAQSGERGTPLGDWIRALGVPLEAVDLVLVDGVPADFSRVLAGGERVSVYPVFESFDISRVTRLRPKPLRDLRFAAGPGLRGLAVYLRLLGFDALHRAPWAPGEIEETCQAEARVLLLRETDRRPGTGVSRRYRVRGARPRDQTVEVVSRFDLLGSAAPFSRCLRCGSAAGWALADAEGDPGRPGASASAVCPACGRVYRRGARDRRRKTVAAFLLARAGGAGEPDPR